MSKTMRKTSMDLKEIGGLLERKKREEKGGRNAKQLKTY